MSESFRSGRYRFRTDSIFFHQNQLQRCFQIICPICAQQTKKPLKKSRVFDCGGEIGIRTLVGVLAQTRFPVVRLRPAQPSFHRVVFYHNFSAKSRGNFAFVRKKHIIIVNEMCQKSQFYRNRALHLDKNSKKYIIK